MFAGFSICERKTYDSFKSEEIDYKRLLRYDTVEFDNIIDAEAHRWYIHQGIIAYQYRVKRSISCKTKRMLGRRSAKRRSSKLMDKCYIHSCKPMRIS